ncbi:MAG TPA: hypothetical protein VLT36_17620 [Candidatus Dormibacteraeota bacterium]|nr:hypothetical protein [Candidatus Dormibacteraeota bacterium]
MQRKLSPRDEYLLQEKQRVTDSATLLEKFQDLKALSVDIAYLDSEDRVRRGQMKYTVNVAHAKSVFRLSCPNRECVEGDFDLSSDLASAIAGRQPTVAGELVCPGWQSRTTIGRLPCRTILSYTLNLEYQEMAVPSAMDSAKR